jgi:hypothetical protein
MPIERDKKRGTFVFVFDRRIGGQRVRARKRLPRAWNQAQADAFDRQETARLYAAATRTPGAGHLIDDAVTIYLKERVPQLKAGLNAARSVPKYVRDAVKALGAYARAPGEVINEAAAPNRIVQEGKK